MILLQLGKEDRALFDSLDMYGYVCSSCGKQYAEIAEIEEYSSLDPFYFWLCKSCLLEALEVFDKGDK